MVKFDHAKVILRNNNNDINDSTLIVVLWCAQRGWNLESEAHGQDLKELFQKWLWQMKIFAEWFAGLVCLSKHPQYFSCCLSSIVQFW